MHTPFKTIIIFFHHDVTLMNFDIHLKALCQFLLHLFEITEILRLKIKRKLYGTMELCLKYVKMI